MAELVEFVAGLAPARVTPLFRAGRARLEAERAWLDGNPDAAREHEAEAIGVYREIGARPWLARALEERGRRGGDGDALNEAREIYLELGATRWLEQFQAAVASATTVV